MKSHDHDDRLPWSQQRREPGRAFAAFVRYRALPRSDRSWTRPTGLRRASRMAQKHDGRRAGPGGRSRGTGGRERSCTTVTSTRAAPMDEKESAPTVPPTETVQ